jgi:hypothetical protein
MDDPVPTLTGERERRSWTRRLSERWVKYRQESPEEAEARSRSEAEVAALIERIAEWVHRRRLETPAILFLETHKPFSYLGSQFLLVGTPAAAPLFGLQNLKSLYRLMEKSENVDRLIARIEELAEAR